MKNLAVLISSMALLTFISIGVKGDGQAQSTKTNDSIHIWCSPNLDAIATTWIEAYKKVVPEAKIDMVTASSERMYLALQNPGNIALVTKEYYPALDAQQNWSMIVGRDVIVPIMNRKNPFLDQIKMQGISPEDFAKVFTNTELQHWGMLLNNQESIAVNCYLLNDESTQPFLTDFFKTDIQKITGNKVVDVNELVNKIKSDTYAIGFCKLSAILDSEDKELEKGIALIPIDINGNQKLDYYENIYDNYSDLTRGLWIGKYPKELYSRIYTVTSAAPTLQHELAFLDWVLYEGQQYLADNGLTEITLVEQQRRNQSLYATQNLNIETKPQNSTAIVFLIVLAICLTAFIIVYSFVTYRNYRQNRVEPSYNTIPTAFGEHTVETLNGLFFDKTHTWAYMEKNGGIRIGIDDFLQHVTGSITKIRMKKPGEYIKKGEPFLTLIQQGKQLEINAPASGIIKENNENLTTQASLINSSPYNQGWVYIIESENWLKEIRSFLMGDAYKIWLNFEFDRLKTFFSITVNNKLGMQNQLVMQDGGELKDNILESFGPEVWEEFQIRFINHFE
ncbi:MAG: substrate-binding domain-containing protein [Salinivirgaceae bacterium]|jgi:glycine cleavage system H lipoate-binding protein/ABC-type phosphate transport system substrate-binding protein